MRGPQTAADGRVIRLESALWETTSLLVLAGGEALAIDPGVSAEEVERVREEAAEAGVRVSSVLVTHADWDHVSGLAAFPDATVAMGAGSAARIESGEAAAALLAEGDRYALRFTGAPRCDRVLRDGEAFVAAGLTVETLALPGHTPDGTAYRMRELGLLAVGDHLSPVEYPFAGHSTAAYRATLAGLVELLRSDPPEVVAPGHGPLLSAGEALALAEEDLAYLRALHRAVRDALAAGDGVEAARAAGLAVAVPRPAADDLAGAHADNVERQLAELVSG